MKKTCYLLILLIAVIALLSQSGYAITSKMITDAAGDVEGENNPDVDIERLTYYQDDNNHVTITLKVAGRINSNDIYIIGLETTAGEYYMGYSKNPLSEFPEDGFVSFNNNTNISSDFSIPKSDTLRITFQLAGGANESYIGVYASSMFVDLGSEEGGGYDEAYSSSFQVNETENNNQSTENGSTPSQGDNNKNNNENNNGNNNSSPGFEYLLTIVAIFVAIIFFAKKR